MSDYLRETARAVADILTTCACNETSIEPGTFSWLADKLRGAARDDDTEDEQEEAGATEPDAAAEA